MDAPSLTPERSRELADLRKRAYGPDADIAHDPEALERLHELEEQLRSDTPEPVVLEAAEPAAAVAPAVDARNGSTAMASPVASEPPSAPAPLPSQKSRPWWRRVPLWVSLAIIGLLGVLVGIMVPAAVAPGADTTLHPSENPVLALDDEWLSSMLDWLQVNEPPTEFEPFDNLQVITAISETGSTCLVVFWVNQWSDASCTPDGLTPTVDFVAYPGSPQPLDDIVPVGTVIRFELHGDEVDVTLREPEAEQRSASGR
ncbi:hypothetical protein [Microbacterium pumilum]